MNYLLLLLSATSFPLLAHASVCNVERTSIFSQVLIDHPGTGIGASRGQPLLLSDGSMLQPIGPTDSDVVKGPGYLLIAPHGKTSRMIPFDPAIMNDYGPIQLKSGEIAIGTLTGEIYLIDLSGKALKKLLVAKDEAINSIVQLKDGSLLATGRNTATIYHISQPTSEKESLVTPFYSKKEITENFVAPKELADGHIVLLGAITDEIGVDILNSDGSLYVNIPELYFDATLDQPATEFPGVVAISGRHYIPGEPKMQNSIAYVDLVTKQIKYVDYGYGTYGGGMLFIKKMNLTDYLIGNFIDDYESLMFFHNDQKVWENKVLNPSNDLAMMPETLSDSTIVQTANGRAEFYSGLGGLKSTFDFNSDLDPFTHTVQGPMNPLVVTADDTVIVPQWFYQGIRFSYLKLHCE